MATTATGLVFWPGFPVPRTTVSSTATTLDATSDSYAVVFDAEEDATITHVCFRQGTATGTPGNLRVGIQGVNTSGIEDGTWLGGGSGYGDYTPVSGNNNTIVTVTLGASVSLQRGSQYAIVCDPESGTWDGSNRVTITILWSGLDPVYSNPYYNVGGSKMSSGPQRSMYLMRSSSRSYGMDPFQTTATLSFNSGSTPDEAGLRWTMPSGAGSTYQVVGLRFAAQFVTSGAYTVTMRLYDTDGSTVLQNRTIDVRNTYNFTQDARIFFFDEDTLADLDFGSEYTATLLPDDTAGGFSHTFRYMTLASAGDTTVWTPGEIQWVERTNAGAWTETPTRVPLMDLIVRGIDPGASGGGLLRHPGMKGGLNG